MARVALICAFAASAAGNAVELTPDNFDKEVTQSGKAAFIKFLAPWYAASHALSSSHPYLTLSSSTSTR